MHTLTKHFCAVASLPTILTSEIFKRIRDLGKLTFNVMLQYSKIKVDKHLFYIDLHRVKSIASSHTSDRKFHTILIG
jgi:hypothetical protein